MFFLAEETESAWRRHFNRQMKRKKPDFELWTFTFASFISPLKVATNYNKSIILLFGNILGFYLMFILNFFSLLWRMVWTLNLSSRHQKCSFHNPSKKKIYKFYLKFWFCFKNIKINFKFVRQFYFSPFSNFSAVMFFAPLVMNAWKVEIVHSIFS